MKNPIVVFLILPVVIYFFCHAGITAEEVIKSGEKPAPCHQKHLNHIPHICDKVR